MSTNSIGYQAVNARGEVTEAGIFTREEANQILSTDGYVSCFVAVSQEHAVGVCVVNDHGTSEMISRDDECADDETIDDEPRGSHDLSDDGDALASAGFGTDEDYGGYGGDDW